MDYATESTDVRERRWRAVEAARTQRAARAERIAKGITVPDAALFAELHRGAALNADLDRSPLPDRQPSAEFDAFKNVTHDHQLDYRPPPFEALPAYKSHGGNPPHQQIATANSGGGLQIITVIDADSSQTFCSTAIQVPIQPLWYWEKMSFRPYVEYWVQHYLLAGGTGQSHSDGTVLSAIFSTDDLGNDLKEDGRSPGMTVFSQSWTDGYGGSTGTPPGGSPDPDDEGVVSPPLLQVDISGVDNRRMYYGRVWIESNSDADGVHLLYASQAYVQFRAYVRSAWVEQTGLLYVPS